MSFAVNHFCFTVGDIDRSVDFYVECFGFSRPEEILVVEDPWISEMTTMPETSLRIAFLELGDASLELIQYASPVDGDAEVRTRTKDVGSAHIAIDLPSIEEIEPVLKKWGGRLVTPPVLVRSGPWEGRRICYATDADGIVLELVEPFPDS